MRVFLLAVLVQRSLRGSFPIQGRVEKYALYHFCVFSNTIKEHWRTFTGGIAYSRPPSASPLWRITCDITLHGIHPWSDSCYGNHQPRSLFQSLPRQITSGDIWFRFDSPDMLRRAVKNAYNVSGVGFSHHIASYMCWLYIRSYNPLIRWTRPYTSMPTIQMTYFSVVWILLNC